MNKDFNDPFACFYEESEIGFQARMILDQARRNIPPPEDGMTHPFILLDGCTEAEKEIVGKHLKEQSDRTQQQLAEQATPQPEPPPNCFGQAYPPGIWDYELEALFHGVKKKNQELNTYEAMVMVLRRMRVVYYERKFYIQQDSIFQQIDEDNLKMEIFGVLKPLLAAGKSHKIVNSIVDELKMNGDIRATQTSDHDDRVFFLNGAYSISRQEFAPILPTDFFTTYIPVHYMPYNCGCPYFDAFLQRVSGGDKRIIRLIWEMIGYLLAPDMEGKAFFVLQGAGNTGKSVLGNLIASLFNPESVANIDIYRFRDRFAPAELRGKRLNVSMDLPRTQLSREAIGVIKQITGDDTIATEQKFKAIESQKPTCKLLFGSNFPLMPADNDAAFRSRLVTVPFCYPVPPEQQDKHLLEKLMGERMAIVIRALDVLQDLRRRNYQFIRVTETIDVNGYIAEHQLMDEFLTRCCCFDPAAFTFTADLLDAYNIYRASRNVPPLENPSIFSRNLNQFCSGQIVAKRRRCNGQNLNGYEGIRLTNIIGG